ncbi:hypothetical protein Tsubulata_001050 [Turnera subulata]|uniref:Uncharacterized protein n=1 Tax=Turnera subulata TaxID=218843 RepID=A0A9Q0FM16_9ROSI|nr:hypothetical protein Tsubulata_001050 [Turnera subulata]
MRTATLHFTMPAQGGLQLGVLWLTKPRGRHEKFGPNQALEKLVVVFKIVCIGLSTGQVYGQSFCCLEVERGGGGKKRIEWYSFKLSSDDVKCKTRDPGCFCCKHVHRNLRDCPTLWSPRVISRVDDDHGEENGWGLLGNHLYRLGERRIRRPPLPMAAPHMFHRPELITEASVDAIDLGRPEEGWKRKPRMLTPRCNPATLTVGGKLYVLGGGRHDQGPWGEVYDPSTNKWTALPDPSLCGLLRT